MKIRALKVSFDGGETAPEMLGRIDDGKYQSGLAVCRNTICLTQGSTQNRSGTMFVREVKDSEKKVRIIPFTFSTTQTMVIEMGAGYFRFHTRGATLLDPDTNEPYEIENPFSEDELFEINYVQSADVMTFAHQNHRPMELRRYGATDWRTNLIDFDSPIAKPASVTAVSNSKGNDYDYTYAVTAVHENQVSESEATASNTIKNNIYATGAKNTISWEAVEGAWRYRVYLKSSGMFAYIGETEDTSFVDNNIAPDTSKTPPTYDTSLMEEGSYPASVSYYEQRRIFAGTKNDPAAIWMTRPGTENDMSYSVPSFDDDRIRFRANSRDANTIRHVVPLTQLIVLTSSAEWAVTSVNSDALTPTSIDTKTQSSIGAAYPRPVIANNAILFVAERGHHVRELGYSYERNGFITADVSIRAAHLFDGFKIVDMAYAKAPQQIVWLVSSNGNLLGLTYMPEQRVGSWHRHDTDGYFESCCCLAEDDEDILYVVVRREINGRTVRYIERMDEMLLLNLEDAFFVDSGLKYDDADNPISVLSGLEHLEGKTVSILGDGIVFPQQVVRDGTVTIDHPCGKLAVGLPIQSEIKTLPVVAQIDAAYGQGRTKNVHKVKLRVHKSSGIWAGADADSMREYKQRTDEPYGTPPRWKDEEIEILLQGTWSDGGQVYIRQDDPLPLRILSCVAETSIGG